MTAEYELTTPQTRIHVEQQVGMDGKPMHKITLQEGSGAPRKIIYRPQGRSGRLSRPDIRRAVRQIEQN
ncbi:MAG: hypothetical protein KGL95_15600, partial [Patescibacteria group bacterium]|nr:hypothetical protein [Patescibacteria group bacterium]